MDQNNELQHFGCGPKIFELEVRKYGQIDLCEGKSSFGKFCENAELSQ